VNFGADLPAFWLVLADADLGHYLGNFFSFFLTGTFFFRAYIA
jgi:hypothetical protein